MMKSLLLIISLLVLITKSSEPLDQFAKKTPMGWSTSTKKNKLYISKDSLISIQYCHYGVQVNPPIVKHQYIVTIEYSKRLSQEEIKTRQFLQDSILDSYDKKNVKKTTKTNMAAYEDFDNKRQKTDSLRVPFLSDDQYSYFLMDNFPYGHCYIDERVRSEIDSLLLKLRK